MYSLVIYVVKFTFSFTRPMHFYPVRTSVPHIYIVYCYWNKRSKCQTEINKIYTDLEYGILLQWSGITYSQVLEEYQHTIKTIVHLTQNQLHWLSYNIYTSIAMATHILYKFISTKMVQETNQNYTCNTQFKGWM